MDSTLSGLPAHLWAKSAKAGAEGESLARHTALVADTLARLAARSPQLADVAGDPRLWHRAFWACWLHDLGKAARAFQAYLRGRRGHWEHRHEILSLVFLDWVAPPDSEDFAWIASGIASHHRDAPLILEQRYDPDLPLEDLDLEALVAELDDEAIRGVWTWLREAGPTWITRLGLRTFGVENPEIAASDLDVGRFRQQAPLAITAALRAYRKVWRAQVATRSDRPQNRQALLLRGLVLLSDHLASAHAPALESLVLPDAPTLLERAGVPQRPLKSHQERAGRTEGSVVLAAPTGSGKTEAALLWARHQQLSRATPSKLIYLLPYQASANAMRFRLERALETQVGLLHGRSAQVLYRELAERGYAGQEAERAARRATDLTRLHHPPVWVATPYQLLRAAYRLPGYEIGWVSMARSLIVVDEPHAYEPARLGLILGLLAELVRHWGVRVCAMSATLPTWLRKLLQDHLQALALPVDREVFAAFRRHRLQLLPGRIDGSAAVNLIAQHVQEGRSVLVAVNTVGRAQQMRQVLRDRLGADRVRLLHSRFTGRDRLEKEREILNRLRPGAESVQPLAVVSTQVIEVSLELDFDIAVSEPAPLEALAQRFGRVNRRGRRGQNGIVPVYVLTEPAEGQGVYDRRLVQRTLEVLQKIDGQVLDEAVLADRLDEAYDGDLAQEFGALVERQRQEFEASCLRSLRAFESDETLAEQFDRLFDGSEVLPASLEGEYRSAVQESILTAQGLLVPLAYRQLRRIGDRGRWSPELGVHIVDLPYDPDLGLAVPPVRRSA